MSDSKPCPQCGGPLPQDGALGGACPRCMLELGFETSAGTTRRSEPGTPAERLAIIGRYRILRLIGEGGMGAVYEAEQDHPRRTVALKIIKTGMASPELLRRFEQESQALGRLQHPGIAQIYEAGTVDTGFGPQPYFAMELIRGRSPRDYAEEHHLNARERLQMMVKICDAVHHAHQRGLIHRDLKPGNILVDGTGQPKILDFGVARVTDSDARATLQTDMGQLIGTLAYMSPEQALADPLDLDTRTDVYSLGVILYELLSGRLPYTVSRKVHEAIQSIREEDPARLSTCNRSFRGDIETIVAKALEKERDRRYASAAEMAADIQRYLSDEPIVARRPTASYQLQKFARRNRSLVAGVGLVFVVLIAAVTAVVWYAARVTQALDRVVKAEEQVRQERDRARSAEHATSIALDRAVTAEEQIRGERDLAIQAQNRSDTDSATAKAIFDFVRNYVLTFPDPRIGTPLAAFARPNPNFTVREALDRAAANIAGNFDSQPLVEAALRETIADSYLSLGLYADGQSQLEHAVELRRKTQGWAHPDSLTTLKALAEQKRRATSNASELEALLREIVDIESRVLGIENPQTMASMENLVRLYHFGLRYSEEEALLVKIIAIRSRTTDTPDVTSVTRLIYLIEAYEKQGKSEQAKQVREKLEVIFRELGEKNDITQSGLGLLFTFYLDNYPNRPESEALFGRIENTSLLRIASMPDLQALPGMIGLVQVYQQLGKSEKANQLSARIEAKLRTLGPGNPMTIQVINNFRLRTRRSLPDMVDLVNAALPEPGAESLRDIEMIRGVAIAYYDQGKYREAERLYLQALETSNRLLSKEDQDSLAVRMELAGVYVLEGKLDMAEEKFIELLAINRRASGPEERTTLLTMTLLGWSRLHQHKYVEVEMDLREVLRSLEKMQPDEWERYNCLSILGASVAGQKRFAEAELLLLSAYDGMISKQSTVARPYPIRPKLQEEGGLRIVQLYEDWGKPEEAAKWRQNLRAAEERALREPPRK